LWAHLQPEIIYDETVKTNGLDRYSVLVMMDCDVLTAGVAATVQAFQARGGVVVGDERLCPAIQADITLASYTRTGKADEDRAALIAKSAELRAALDTRYQRYCDASTPDVVPRCRSYGSTDYLFAVNDRREFGDYVGQYGLVMENGVPATAVLSLARSSGHVYDLVEGCALDAHVRDGRLTVAHTFGPCDGCVLMVTERRKRTLVAVCPARFPWWIRKRSRSMPWYRCVSTSSIRLARRLRGADTTVPSMDNSHSRLIWPRMIGAVCGRSAYGN
jgi:hypothetical protein